MRLIGLVTIACWVSFISGCQQTSLQQKFDNHPILNPTKWQALAAKPLAERFEIANAEVIDYVNLDNQIYGFPERPTPAVLSAEFSKDVSDALASMPEPVVNLVSPFLKGIVFLENLGSSGYTAYVTDTQKNPVGAFIVLDVSAMQRNANEWSSWKENTPFSEDPSIQIVSTIETEENDTRTNALRYILLHEFAHVISVNRDLKLRYDFAWDCKSDRIDNYPFLQLSWQVDQDKCAISSHFDRDTMPNRSKVKYYSAGALPKTEAVPLYQTLKRTNFPTLYASTNWFDDFAESFVSYVHTQLDQRPFKIDIYENQRLLEQFEGCWNTDRCADKQRYFEQLLKSQ